MRIAILTLPLHTNYGGILQCYALQTVLIRMGHEVRVLVKPIHGVSYYIRYPLSVCKRIVKRYILGQDINIFNEPHEIIRKNTNKFIKQNIYQYKCRTWSEKIADKFDAIIVGSDQIWRPQYLQNISIEEAFLSFLVNSNIKRISYAASFGVGYCDFTESQLKRCSKLLQKFDTVSVREKSGVDLCRKYFGVNAKQVLDPTLLLTTEDYRSLTKSSKEGVVKRNMLVYILDATESVRHLVNHIAEIGGFTTLWMDSDIDETYLPLKERIKRPVEQWIRSFDNADFIFTDSFHGCVFSVIFKKQFVVLGNEHRGIERVESLLTLLSLQERLIRSVDDYEYEKVLNSKIDYKKVDVKLDLERKSSMDFLYSSLGSI